MTSSRQSTTNTQLARTGEWAATVVSSAGSVSRYCNPFSLRRVLSPSKRAMLAGVLTVSVACSSIQPADEYQYRAPEDSPPAIYTMDEDSADAAAVLEQMIKGANAQETVTVDSPAAVGLAAITSSSEVGSQPAGQSESSSDRVASAASTGAPNPAAQQFFASPDGASAADAESRIVSAMNALASIASGSNGQGSSQATGDSTGGQAVVAALVVPTPTPAKPVTPLPTAAPVKTVTPAPTAVPVKPVTPAPTAVLVKPVTPAPTAAPVKPVTPAPTAAPVKTVTPAPTVVPVKTVTPVPAAAPHIEATEVVPTPGSGNSGDNTGEPSDVDKDDSGSEDDEVKAGQSETSEDKSKGKGRPRRGRNRGRSGPNSEPTPVVTPVPTAEPADETDADPTEQAAESTPEPTVEPAPEPTVEPTPEPVVESTPETDVDPATGTEPEAGDIDWSSIAPGLLKQYEDGKITLEELLERAGLS